MNRRRLRKLAKFLKTVPPKRFDMGKWASFEFSKENCGTSACAFGWATVCFPRSGLSMGPMNCVMDTVLFNDQDGEDAAMAFFDLTEDQVDEIFLSDPMTPKQKAKHIEQLLERTKA